MARDRLTFFESWAGNLHRSLAILGKVHVFQLYLPGRSWPRTRKQQQQQSHDSELYFHSSPDGVAEGEGTAIPFFTISTASSCGSVNLNWSLFPSALTCVFFNRTSSSLPLGESAPAARM